MKTPYHLTKHLRSGLILGALFSILCLIPDIVQASETAAAQYFVSAWLVRIWLAMVCGTAIVFGVMVAMDGYSSKHTLDPELNEENQVVLVKNPILSYRKVGGGLLCVVVGCALFVTTVFLLPVKRTGYSGIDTIRKHFNGVQVSLGHGVAPDETESPSQQHH